MRSFYYSNRSQKEKRTQRLLTNAAYDRLASLERKFIAADHETGRKQKNRIVMCIGREGTGVGLRVSGHTRRGGSQLRRRHRRYATIAMTDEHGTSQTCSSCFSQVIRPKAYKYIKDTWKLVSVNGNSLCLNRKCPRYKTGHNTMNRDVEAAKCIALAVISRMVSGATLPPFTSKSSQCNTADFPYYHEPRLTSAQSVPAPAGLR